ncbi:hypothetical protein [Acuticoccus sp. I52.16.1]|uniref:hypothetical protein n=1 Tax=Acuticoccus sp. I52.16.1 TaxID=2928472 RepID=UPI001FD0802D|nr:hypothetical protein [Acuticoccus sp. I52.16.1]UOM37017.1 hypothetical protein MRB58_16515 [Acuticoccus sp. I52.16.1]
MSSSEVQEEEEPLDPAVERVRRKLVRLLLVSSSVMLLGFAAVAIAVFYRISESGARPDGTPVALDVAAEEVRAVTADDGMLVITIGGATPRIEVRRMDDGVLMRRFDLTGAPAAAPE